MTDADRIKKLAVAVKQIIQADENCRLAFDGRDNREMRDVRDALDRALALVDRQRVKAKHRAMLRLHQA